MAERAYTVVDIDRMREIIKWTMTPRTRLANGHIAYEISRGPSAAVVEDRLRTYMLAGVTAEDLEAHWKERREREVAAQTDRR